MFFVEFKKRMPLGQCPFNFIHYEEFEVHDSINMIYWSWKAQIKNGGWKTRILL